MTIMSMELPETGPVFGSLRLLRAEWWSETKQFVLLRYALDGEEQPTCLRLDLDKRAVMDDLQDVGLSSAVRARSLEIWALVVAEQRKRARDGMPLGA
jgi:hypothetical protein